MAITVAELKDWLEHLNENDEVYIDDGGLTLVVANSALYLEVGGEPDELGEGAI